MSWRLECVKLECVETSDGRVGVRSVSDVHRVGSHYWQLVKVNGSVYHPDTV